MLGVDRRSRTSEQKITSGRLYLITFITLSNYIYHDCGWDWNISYFVINYQIYSKTIYFTVTKKQIWLEMDSDIILNKPDLNTWQCHGMVLWLPGTRPFSRSADLFSAGRSKIRLASRFESARRQKFGWRRRQHLPAAAARVGATQSTLK